MDNLITPEKNSSATVFVCALSVGPVSKSRSDLPIKSRRNPVILSETVVFQRFLTDSGSSLSPENKCQRTIAKHMQQTYKHTNSHGILIV